MTVSEYLDFLEQYWQLFEYPKEPRPKKNYTNVLI